MEKDPGTGNEKKLGLKIKDAQHLIPGEWSGEKDGSFNELAHDIITYMWAISEESKGLLKKVAQSEEVLGMNEYSDVDYPNKKFLNSHLYATLSKITKGEAKKIVRNSEENGLAAWHALHLNYSPKSATDSSVSIQKLMYPIRGKDAESTKVALEAFETDCREHVEKMRWLASHS